MDRATLDHDSDGEPVLVCKGREARLGSKVQLDAPSAEARMSFNPCAAE